MIHLITVIFFVSPTTGEVSGVKKNIGFLQEPSYPLDPIITEITGFRDEDLKGESIPWDKVGDHHQQTIPA